MYLDSDVGNRLDWCTSKQRPVARVVWDTALSANAAQRARVPITIFIASALYAFINTAYVSFLLRDDTCIRSGVDQRQWVLTCTVSSDCTKSLKSGSPATPV